MLVMRHHRQAQQFIPKFQRRGVRLSFAEGRLVRRLPSLVVKPDLMRSFRPLPSQFKRRVCTVIVEPRRFSCAVPVCALPHLANPLMQPCSLPSDTYRLRKPVGGKGTGFCWVLQHTAPLHNGAQRSRETAAVISGPVMVAAPSGVIHVRHRAPQLAWRVRNNRQRPRVAPRVSLFRPGINVRQSRIASIRLHKQCGQAHNISVQRTCHQRRFAPSRHAAELHRYASLRLIIAWLAPGEYFWSLVMARC